MKRTNLLQLLEDFTGNKLYTPGTEGGGEIKNLAEEEQKQASAKDHLLKLELENVIKNNGNWLKIIYGILAGLIILLSVFLWRKQDDMAYFFAILGGQGASIIFCINRLSYFYKQKRGSEVLLCLYKTAETPEVKSKILGEVIKLLKGKD